MLKRSASSSAYRPDLFARIPVSAAASAGRPLPPSPAPAGANWTFADRDARPRQLERARHAAGECDLGHRRDDAAVDAALDHEPVRQRRRPVADETDDDVLENGIDRRLGLDRGLEEGEKTLIGRRRRAAVVERHRDVGAAVDLDVERRPARREDRRQRQAVADRAARLGQDRRVRHRQRRHPVAVELDEARPLVHDLECVVRDVRSERQVAIRLAADRRLPATEDRDLTHGQVEELSGRLERVGGHGDVAVDLDPEEVAPRAGIEDRGSANALPGPHAGHRVHPIREDDGRGRELVRRDRVRPDPDDPRLRATVEEELRDGVASLRKRVQAAELPLEVGHAEDLDRGVDRSAGERVDERPDRRRNARDRVDAAGYLFDVDARVGRRDRHRVAPFSGGEPSVRPRAWRGRDGPLGRCVVRLERDRRPDHVEEPLGRDVADGDLGRSQLVEEAPPPLGGQPEDAQAARPPLEEARYRRRAARRWARPGRRRTFPRDRRSWPASAFSGRSPTTSMSGWSATMSVITSRRIWGNPITTILMSCN